VLLSSLLVLTGLETVTHGQLTPGGGSRAGWSWPALSTSSTWAPTTRRSSGSSRRAAGGLRRGGCLRVRVIGLLGLLAGDVFLSNVVGLGVTGNLIAGGTIPLLNLVVGVEVAGAFAILASEFLDQTTVIRTRRR
jgi:Domain related to MnhB subunit of Na+/H+ antiporter.